MSYKKFKKRYTYRKHDKRNLDYEEAFKKTGKTLEVKCAWAEKGWINIDPDGQVQPCCFFGCAWWYATKKPLGYTEIGHQNLINEIPLMQEYIDRAEEFNVKNRPIQEIVKDPLFNKKLTRSWQDYKTLPRPCRDHCSNAIPFDTGDNMTAQGSSNATRQEEQGDMITIQDKQKSENFNNKHYIEGDK